MRLLLTLAGAAISVGVAAPALADPPPDPDVPADPAADSHFLDSLKNVGMSYSSGPSAIAAGRLACQMMDQGIAEQDVVSKLSMLNPGLNLAGATKFAALASTAYCPDYLHKSSARSKSNSPSGGFGGMSPGR